MRAFPCFLAALAVAVCTPLLAACDGGGYATDATAIARPADARPTTTGGAPTAGVPAPASCAEATTAAFCADTSEMEIAAVLRIIDGDTLDVMFAGREERVRIFGVDAPERGDPCYSQAAALLRDLAGSEIRMRSDVRTMDRNGRLLRYVYRADGLSIDAELIRAGRGNRLDPRRRTP
jgi:endonuclease YncB( thermonuclease family)